VSVCPGLKRIVVFVGQNCSWHRSAFDLLSLKNKVIPESNVTYYGIFWNYYRDPTSTNRGSQKTSYSNNKTGAKPKGAYLKAFCATLHKKTCSIVITKNNVT
jgi:hypothetical protein